mgnify:CR=1 FL=1
MRWKCFSVRVLGRAGLRKGVRPGEKWTEKFAVRDKIVKFGTQTIRHNPWKIINSANAAATENTVTKK